MQALNECCKYFKDPRLLINDIDMKLDECDFDFFIKLGQVFSEFGKSDDSISDLIPVYMEALTDSISQNMRSPKFDIKDINGDNIVAMIMRKAIFDYSYGEIGLAKRKHRKKTLVKLKNLSQVTEFVRKYDLEYEQEHGIPAFIFSNNVKNRTKKIGSRSVPGQTRMDLKY